MDAPLRLKRFTEMPPPQHRGDFARRDYTGDANVPLSQSIRDLVTPIIGQNGIGSIRMLSVSPASAITLTP